jgi:ADP-ribose pyrophosphatase
MARTRDTGQVSRVLLAGRQIQMPQRPDWVPEPSHPHEEQTSTERGFDGKLLHVRVDQVRLPSGRPAVREIVEHPGSVVIVPVTVERTVLLIQQYRYAVDEYLLELPAGLIDPGEMVLPAAGRELTEETGYQAGSLEILADVYVSPGYSQERTRIVLADHCEPVPHDPDIDEPIQIIHLSLVQVPDLLTRRSPLVANMQAMLGLMWLYRLGYCDEA